LLQSEHETVLEPSMNEHEKLIPPPPLLREHLARNLRERRYLRALLRLSVKAAEDRRQESPALPRLEPTRQGVES
jgi:hypothetical protein